MTRSSPTVIVSLETIELSILGNLYVTSIGFYDSLSLLSTTGFWNTCWNEIIEIDSWILALTLTSLSGTSKSVESLNFTLEDN